MVCFGGLGCCCLIGVKTDISFSAAKWFYFGLFLFSCIVAWILRDYAEDVVDNIPGIDACSETRNEVTCFGKGAVLRVSFASFILHALHAIFLIKCKYENDPRIPFHVACPTLKVFLWIVLLIAVFFIPNEFYTVYGEIAKFLSALFLIYQAIVIMETIYKTNEYLLEQDNCLFALILLTIIGYGVSFAFIILSYMYFAPEASCSVNIFWITMTMLFGLIVSLISISPWRVKYAGLLTSAAVFAYCSFLCISALYSEPKGSCYETSSSGWIEIISFFIVIGTVSLATVASGTADILNSDPTEGDPVPYRPDIFHIIFCLASLYVAMLFTNWNLDDTSEDLSIDRSWESAWIKIGSQWFIFALYTWTLVAPAIFPNREF